MLDCGIALVCDICFFFVSLVVIRLYRFVLVYICRKGSSKVAGRRTAIAGPGSVTLPPGALASFGARPRPPSIATT